MATQLFLNLPVKNLSKSIEFFTRLGYSFNPQFSNESGTCMVISDTIFVMLLTEEFYQTFTSKKIADATKTSECLICLSADSRKAVDEMVSKAVASGGAALPNKQDHGWMYGHGYTDLDGHHWEIAFMDLQALQNAEPATAESIH